MPNQLQTPASTACTWAAVSVPIRRTSHASGMVTRPCASKAPGLRKRVATTTSKRDPRTLVVCGTSVTMARSLPSPGTLMTRQDLTFAVIPRSTSQTSPRGGAFNAQHRADQAPKTRHQQPGATARWRVLCRALRWEGAADSLSAEPVAPIGGEDRARQRALGFRGAYGVLCLLFK